jgi:hypothetical protein
LGADGWEKLPRAALVTTTTTATTEAAAILIALASAAATVASARLVGEAFACVELLLTSGELEARTAIAAH